MGVVIKNDLEKFLNKLSDAKKTMVNKFAQIVAEDAKNIISIQYAGMKYANNITISEIVDGSFTVSVEGEGITFVEYGTGHVGEGTYPGQLPTETITFESPKGDKHTTNGWEYYYKNEKTKVNGGWFYGNTFTTGRPAGAQMFNASQELRRKYEKNIKE